MPCVVWIDSESVARGRVLKEDVLDWMDERELRRPCDWTHVAWGERTMFIFESEYDATMFKLRWG